jgi:hypothetical protein
MIGRRFDGFDGMIFPKCASIHTCFMGIEIDVLFLDEANVVVGIREYLDSWSMASVRGAKSIIELPAGTAEGIRIGDQMEIQTAAASVRPKVQEGDLVFIATPSTLYRRVAAASGTWTSHIGFVYGTQNGECLVAESKRPLSQITTFDEFVARSDFGQFAVMRLHDQPDAAMAEALRKSADSRMRVPYNLWFNYESDWQFCSKFVYDCYREVLGVEIGDLETFRDVMEARPNMPLAFWRLWFLGRIPWQKTTVSPGAQLDSPHLKIVHHDTGISSPKPKP